MLDFHAHESDEKLRQECDELTEILHKNQRGEWRKRYVQKDAGNLVIAARAAGVTHLAFIRHANSAPLPSSKPDQPHGWGVDDQTRTLTNRGQAQCVAARSAWYGACPTRPTIVCSPAMRATETGLFMSIEEGDAMVKPKCLTISGLHPASLKDTTACEALFARFGYGPLRPYLDADGGEVAFGRYAQAVCCELAIKFRLNPIQAEQGTYVAIFGHAVWLNSMAYAVATAAGLDEGELDTLLDLELEEAEAILVPLYGGEVQKMYVPL